MFAPPARLPHSDSDISAPKRLREL